MLFRSLVAERDALHADAEALRGSIAHLNGSLVEGGDTMQQTSEERLKQLRAQLDSESREKTAQDNSLAAARQNLERLQGRLIDLQNQTKTERQEHIVKLRLPREGTQSKTSFPVMIRYSQLFFVYDPSNSFNRNTHSLTFESQQDDDVKVKPIRGNGIDMRTAARLLRDMPHSDIYIVCWVYEDSFHTFNQFKQLVTNSGFEYGWSPMTFKDFLTLTKRRVEAPPPL